LSLWSGVLGRRARGSFDRDALERRNRWACTYLRAGVIASGAADSVVLPIRRERAEPGRGRRGRRARLRAPEHQVVEQREQVERERSAGQPEAVCVEVRQRQPAQADAELLNP
jgi:hypothetical protein